MSTNEEIIINAILAGTREYLANAQRVVAGNEEIAASTEATGRAMERTSKRGYLMNQAIFTTRRLMYGLTIATVGSGIAALKWGWDFNSAMQQARVALGPVAGDIGGVDNRLRSLYNFTKYTPFQFKDITIAFRQMYFGMRTLGISADTVQATLKSIVDALSATGRTTPGALNRVAVALQHMAYQGVLTGQAVNQLNRDGIPATAILAKEFGLTGEQIHNVRKQGIPTLEFLKRMNHYIETQPGLANAAQRQAVHSLHGLYTTFKDNMAQLSGALEKGFFRHIQGRIHDMNGWFDSLTKRIDVNNASATSIVRAIGGSGAVMMWTRLTDVARQFWIMFTTVVSAIARSHVFWATVYVVLLGLSLVLHLINPLLQAFGGVLVSLLIPALITWYTVTKIAAFWTGVMALEEALATKATKDLSFFQFLAAIATGKYALAQKAGAFWTGIATLAQNSFFFASLRVEAVLVGLAIRYWAGVLATQALSTSTAFLNALLGEQALVAASAWTATLLPIAIVAGALAVVAGWLYLIITRWQQIKEEFTSLPATVEHPIRAFQKDHAPKPGGVSNWLNRNLGVPTWMLNMQGFPGLATGGTVTRGGLSWVGERGPELLSLPVGASVMPNHEAFNMRESWMGGGRPITVIAKTYLDSHQIAESVADVQSEYEARS